MDVAVSHCGKALHIYVRGCTRGRGCTFNFRILSRMGEISVNVAVCVKFLIFKVWELRSTVSWLWVFYCA